MNRFQKIIFVLSFLGIIVFLSYGLHTNYIGLIREEYFKPTIFNLGYAIYNIVLINLYQIGGFF